MFRSSPLLPLALTALLALALTGCALTVETRPLVETRVVVTQFDKEACKDGGWRQLRRADGSVFRNQGDCVSYAAR